MPKGVYEHKPRHAHARAGKRTTTYRRWQAIKNRCFNPGDKNYRHYGGRGITLCERWLSYVNFLADMGEAPRGMWLDRIDNGKGYEPGNCKWVTPTQQLRNTRRNHIVEFNGMRKCLSEWAEYLGVDFRAIHARVQAYGWPIERALTEPVRARQKRTAV